jgi:hypothetical protein
VSVVHSTRFVLSDHFQVAELYEILLDATLSNPNLAHGREGYYFAENGEYKLYDVAKAYSQALYDLGKGKSPDPTTYSADEVQKYFGVITSFHVDFIYKTDAHLGTLAW